MGPRLWVGALPNSPSLADAEAGSAWWKQSCDNRVPCTTVSPGRGGFRGRISPEPIVT